MHAGVVSPLDGLDVSAVVLTIGSVKVMVILAHEAYRELPFPSLLGPVGVGVVSEVLVQTGGDVEEASVGNGVFVVVAVVEGKDLPSQASCTGGVVPAILLGVEDGLRQRKPRGLSVAEIRQLVLSG